MDPNKLKFVIVSPPQGSGGSIVLHLLCKLLQDKGYDARIFRVGPHSLKNTSKLYFWWKYAGFRLEDKFKELVYRFFKNSDYVKNHRNRFWWYDYYPVKGCKTKWLPFLDDDTIVVYPCIVWGNILGAKHVVRWILGAAPHQFMEGVGGYENSDVLISFAKNFIPANPNAEKRCVSLWNFDYDLYRQTNFEERHGKCYIIRKGGHRRDLPEKFFGPIIDNLKEREIVEVFNQSKYCYSYDTLTFYTVIAAVCGCIPIVVLEEGQKKEECISSDIMSVGVAYGDEQSEIDWAVQSREQLLQKVENIKAQNEENVNVFLDICKNAFI